MAPYDPPPRAPFFMGRKKELDFLHERTSLRQRRRSSAIAIVGPGGIGKTALVNEFLHQSSRRDLFWLSGYETADLDSELDEFIGYLGSQDKYPAYSATVVVDGAEGSTKFSSYAMHLLDMRRTQSLIVTSRRPLGPFPIVDTLRLGGLSEKEGLKLLSKITPRKIRTSELRLLIDKIAGHPLILVLVAQLLNTQTVEQILLQLDGNWNDLLFRLPTTDKKIIEVVAPQIVIANDAMIEMLKKKPQDLHRISPRKFEELIAELIHDMGWEVELTPQSKDGGKDILAVLKTDLGEFLCLVEAKHYHPNRPIQVGLVKQLFGTFVDHGANSAMLVTSSTFTKGAREFQSRHEYALSLREYGDVVDWIQKYKKR